MDTSIRIDTRLGTAIIRGIGAKTARATARAWLKHNRGTLGGGRDAIVCVAVPDGRWHHIGVIGNR